MSNFDEGMRSVVPECRRLRRTAVACDASRAYSNLVIST